MDMESFIATILQRQDSMEHHLLQLNVDNDHMLDTAIASFQQHIHDLEYKLETQLLQYKCASFYEKGVAFTLAAQERIEKGTGVEEKCFKEFERVNKCLNAVHEVYGEIEKHAGVAEKTVLVYKVIFLY